jgi:pyruvate,water dikinase
LSWQPLRRFRNAAIPKINNLRRAQRAGIRIPETWWAMAAELLQSGTQSAPTLLTGPCILRSGSPTEDTRETSNAGQLLSLRVFDHDDFAAILARVIAALPVSGDGDPLGAVFIQPLLEPDEAGVAFFDGYYFERTSAAESNEALTSGTARGEVTRGHLQRDDPWSMWLEQVWGVFGTDGDRAVDVEYARDDAGYVLLQSRPALFDVTNNPTLSLANHKEILGDPPSPWIVSVLVDAGSSVLSFFAAVDKRVAEWQEPYAIELAERAWMNFSFFFRLMDHWGLPRRFVVAGVGGKEGGAADGRLILARFLLSAPRLVWLQLSSMLTVLRIRRQLAQLDVTIDAANTLMELYQANVRAMELAISTNFAINSVLTAMTRVRSALRLRGAARVITQEMMEGYAAIREHDGEEERRAALEDWLEQYGHRGPLESDPMQPRFVELRTQLQADLREPGDVVHIPHSSVGWLTRPFYFIDARREWFRDELMRRWQRIRQKMLTAGERLVAEEKLAASDDVFWLRRHELDGDLSEAAAVAKTRVEHAADLVLPNTASRDELEQHVQEASRAHAETAGKRIFSGIALTTATVEGNVVRARALTSLLGSGRLTSDTILVVAALEPSWAVVFPRVRGVVAEIGGELSHASILLREAGKPALVNCRGIFAAVQDGDRLRIDGSSGYAELIDPAVDPTKE